MSCQACSEAQVPDTDNELTGLTLATYIRVGVANMLISGCQKHLAELIEINRNYILKEASDG